MTQLMDPCSSEMFRSKLFSIAQPTVLSSHPFIDTRMSVDKPPFRIALKTTFLRNDLCTRHCFFISMTCFFIVTCITVTQMYTLSGPHSH